MNRQRAIQYLNALAEYFDDQNLRFIAGDTREVVSALRRPEPDPDTGLVPCGCGGKAILFHQPDIEGPGSDGDRWAVFCEKTCGMETSELTSREYAVEVWNTGMRYKGGAE